MIIATVQCLPNKKCQSRSHDVSNDFSNQRPGQNFHLLRQKPCFNSVVLKHHFFLQRKRTFSSKKRLDGGFKLFLLFSLLPGEMIQFEVRRCFKWVGSNTMWLLSWMAGQIRSPDLKPDRFGPHILVAFWKGNGTH